MLGEGLSHLMQQVALQSNQLIRLRKAREWPFGQPNIDSTFGIWILNCLGYFGDSMFFCIFMSYFHRYIFWVMAFSIPDILEVSKFDQYLLIIRSLARISTRKVLGAACETFGWLYRPLISVLASCKTSTWIGFNSRHKQALVSELCPSVCFDASGQIVFPA